MWPFKEKYHYIDDELSRQPKHDDKKQEPKKYTIISCVVLLNNTTDKECVISTRNNFGLYLSYDSGRVTIYQNPNIGGHNINFERNGICNFTNHSVINILRTEVIEEEKKDE